MQVDEQTKEQPSVGTPYVPRKHMVLDIYYAYANRLLANNPGYWGKYYSHTHNYYICRYVTRNNHKEVEVVISYPEFRKIVEAYFTNAREHIIMGANLNIGHNIGIIAARRVERNFSNRAVNFHETCKQPIDPITGKRVKIIYFDDDDWLRIGWCKTGRIANGGLYKFSPTNDDNRGGGFKKQLSVANKKNTLLKYKYEYFPFVVDLEDLIAKGIKVNQT